MVLEPIFRESIMFSLSHSETSWHARVLTQFAPNQYPCPARAVQAEMGRRDLARSFVRRLVFCFRRTMMSCRSWQHGTTTHRSAALKMVRVLSGFSSVAFVFIVGGAISPTLSAQQSRTVRDGVYTSAQAARGQAIYKERCSTCHGETLGGANAPPLSGNDFLIGWSQKPLSDLVAKIQILMPANEPGTLTRQQAADLAAYALQVGGFPAGQAALVSDEAALKLIAFPDTPAPAPQNPAAAAQVAAFPPFGNLAQIMRGILFPSSNIIFDVQTRDPARCEDTRPNDGGLQPVGPLRGCVPRMGSGRLRGYGNRRCHTLDADTGPTV